MRTSWKTGGLIALAGLVLLAWLSHTPVLHIDDLPVHDADPANGEAMFHAGGCGSCHGAPGEDANGSRLLSGGLELQSPVGLFRVPNISSHPRDGIGAWSELQFVNAMLRGVAPDGRHYYPAFPYASYARMELTDLLDLKAYLDRLPAVAGQPAGHQLAWWARMRWTLGLWKRLYLDPAPVRRPAKADPVWERGRYLVEGPGHCGECHTPRNFALAMDTRSWLTGAPLPEGRGSAPNLTAGPNGLADWSQSDIVYFLESGVDPDFDVVGGPMVAVQENLARLAPADREAIAVYLASLPPSR